MVLVPDVRFIKFGIAFVLTLFTVLAGVIMVAGPAGAQPGARGAAYDRTVLDANGHESPHERRLYIGGYALNPGTKPVQEVKAVVYGQHHRGGKRHQLYASAAHVANGSHYDPHGAKKHLPKADRTYTFAWRSAVFDATYSGGREYPRLVVCVYSHDRNTRGHYSKIDKCRPTTHYLGVDS